MSARRKAAASHAGTVRKRTHKKVIIAGAGLAGLSCAYELRKRGHEVVILEARGRVGGRVETLDGFFDGQIAEAGPYFISDRHRLTWHYIHELRTRRFPLTLLRVLPDQFPLRYYFSGERIDLPQDGLFPKPQVPLSKREKTIPGGVFGILISYSSLPEGEKLGNPAAHGWPPPELKKYDDMSFLEYLRFRGASDGAIALLGPWFAPWLDQFDKISALMIIRTAANGFAFAVQPKWYTISEGMHNLPEAFADKLRKLGVKILTNSPVERIAQNANSVTVTCQGSDKPVKGDYLVCTIPFPVLRRIDGISSFSRGKQNAIKELGYCSIARFYLQFNVRVWDSQPSNGATFTDLSIMNLMEHTYGRPGTRGILQAYVSGDQARAFQEMGESELKDFVLRQMERVYPGCVASLVCNDSNTGANHWAAKFWDKDPWALGAYAYFKPGQMATLIQDIEKPEHRVHFAGDHTSPTPGWMQGAFESGIRAAGEIDPSILIHRVLGS